MKKGAVVANRVAFATDVYFKAPKKQMKCKPRKRPANRDRLRSLGFISLCGLKLLYPHSTQLAIASLQKLIVTAGTSGIMRARMEEVLTARSPVLRTNTRRDFKRVTESYALKLVVEREKGLLEVNSNPEVLKMVSP